MAKKSAKAPGGKRSAREAPSSKKGSSKKVAADRKKGGSKPAKLKKASTGRKAAGAPAKRLTKAEVEKVLAKAEEKATRLKQELAAMKTRVETTKRRLATVTRELVELREDTRGVVTRLRVEMGRKDRALTDRALQIEELRAELEAARRLSPRR